MSINDLPVGRSVEETLRLVKAFQFSDKHGEGKIARTCQFHNAGGRLLVEDNVNITIAICLQSLIVSVCPANWNPETNSSTIKPSPKESKEYFKKAN